MKLEYELELARTELRINKGYIDNLKVYEGVVNGYVMRLKERLSGLEPGCRLLEYRIPAMPAEKPAGQAETESEGTSAERSDVEFTPLSEIVDGTFRIEGRS